MATEIANVIVGVATLEIGVAGTIDGMTAVGYTEDGVSMEYTVDEADIEVEEETFPLKRVITKETLAITCNMAESSLFNIDKAIAGSVLTDPDHIDIGGGVNKEVSIRVVGTAPVETGPLYSRRTIAIPYATAVGAVGMSYKKGEKTVVPVTFQAFKGTNADPVCTIVDA